MNIKNKKKCLIISHDAGGAEILSSYVKRRLDKYVYYVFAAGPALNIFSKKKLITRRIDLKKANDLINKKNIDLIITTTSWASSMELDFIKKAKSNSIRSITIIDHWINYRERFGYPRKNWKNNLPDEIWLGDNFAFNLAQKYFKKPVLKIIKNPYFLEIKKQYAALKKIKRYKSNCILFICEPINEPINSFGDKNKKFFSEFNLLRNVLFKLSEIKINKKVIIRLHPSEQSHKYDNIIAEYQKKIKIVVSFNRNILSDMIKSSHVLGYQSMGLVVGMLCHKKIISYVPGKNKCVLPFTQIYKINDIKKLSNYI